MLHFRQCLRRLNNAAQAFIVKFVGGGASRASAKDRADGDDMVFVFYILMNGVIGEARESKAPTGEEYFDFIGGRKSA